MESELTTKRITKLEYVDIYVCIYMYACMNACLHAYRSIPSLHGF